MLNLNYKFKDDVYYGIRHDKCDYSCKLSINIDNINLPNSIDLSNYITKIYDQGTIGTCVCNSIAYAISLKIKIRTKNKLFGGSIKYLPSRIYNYNLSRIYEGSRLNDNSDCMIETSLDVLQKYSFCDEKLFDYNQSTLDSLPTLEVLENAIYNKRYHNFSSEKLTQNLNTIKSSLAQNNPVFIAIVLFESLNKSINGLIPTPNPKVEKVIGAHSLLIVGYDDNKKRFKVVNCWSENWGDKGFGYIMYDYALNSNIAGDIYNII